jgi:hypothetical protein
VGAVLREQFDAARRRAAHRLDQGLGGVEVARLHAAAADDLMRALWHVAAETLYPAANPTQAERLALIAVGGYGRGVLAPFSDLDLLFLRPWKTTARAEQVTEFVLYALWDLGLKVGHATRSRADCIVDAKGDATVLTALMFLLTIAQLGPFLVLLPAAVWLYWSGSTGLAIALVVWTLFVGTMDNFLRPWLIKKGANLPLLLIFTGVIGGLVSFGLVGIFIGPVVLAVTYTLLGAWMAEQPPAPPPSGPDA